MSEYSSNRNADASFDGQEKFRRFDRNRGVEYKPFKFPTSSTPSENSRRVRWPSERHSINAFDSPSGAANPTANVVFPRSESLSSELQMVDSTTPASPLPQSNKTNEHIFEPLISNTVNMSSFGINQTAVENEFDPLIYIDDDGIFQVKYIPKVENVLISSEDQRQNLTSISKIEESTIISNDNRQIPMDQRISNETNRLSSTTIDLIHDRAVNSTELIFEWTETQANSTSPKPEHQHQQQLMPDNEHPSLFNELPIFA